MGKETKENSSSKEKEPTKNHKKEKHTPKALSNPNEDKNTSESSNDSTEEQLKRLFNFTDFSSTKNKSHVESDMSGVFKGKNVKREYRQYMKRRGGFNKNLEKTNHK